MVIRTEGLLENVSMLETRIEVLESKLAVSSGELDRIWDCKAQIAQYAANDKINQEVFKAQLSIKDHHITTYLFFNLIIYFLLLVVVEVTYTHNLSS